MDGTGVAAWLAVILPTVTLVAEAARGKGRRRAVLDDIEIYERWRPNGRPSTLESMRVSIDGRIRHAARSADATRTAAIASAYVLAAIAFIAAGLPSASVGFIVGAIILVAFSVRLSRFERVFDESFDLMRRSLDEGEHRMPHEVGKASNEDVGHPDRQ